MLLQEGTNNCHFGPSTQSPTKGRNLSHKIDRLRVQMPQGESSQSPLHTGLVFGKGSGGGRVGKVVERSGYLWLGPGHQVGHSVNAAVCS